MKRLCIIGDSHVGAIKRAMGTLPADAGLATTYFAAHHDFWRGVELRGRTLASDNEQTNRIFAATSGGECVIDMDDYDVFVMVGLRFSMGPFVLLSGHSASDSMSAHGPERRRLSDACFEAAGYGTMTKGLAAGLLKRMRAVTDKPIVVLPVPNPSEGVPAEILPWWLTQFYGVSTPEDSWAIRAHFESTCDRVSGTFGIDIIPLPKDAAASGVLNRRDYTMLPAEIATMETNDILNRMTCANERYAALVLPRMLSAAKADMAVGTAPSG